MPYGSALLPRPASLEILIPSRSHLWPLLLPLCSCDLHFGRPPLRDVVPSQALLLSPGPSSMVAAMALPLPGTSVLSYRASSAWCPAACGSPHQAHWSPFQGSFLSLTVEGISLFPGGWVTHPWLPSPCWAHSRLHLPLGKHSPAASEFCQTPVMGWDWVSLPSTWASRGP